MIEFAKVARPDYVIIENVPGLVSLGRKKGKKEGPFVEWIRRAFYDAGYTMEWEIHNAKDYGVPQNRRRVLFTATRRGLKKLRLVAEKDKVTDGPNVYEAIGDLPPIQAGETYAGKPYYNKPREGYVICRNCHKYNKISRKICHNCAEELIDPVEGGIFYIPNLGIQAYLEKRNF